MYPPPARVYRGTSFFSREDCESADLLFLRGGPGPDHGLDYQVRVRGRSYLWGSEGITENVAFPSPLLLHVRNDLFGASVTIGTETASGTRSRIGTLQAGEYVSIPVQNIRGVFATCTLTSTVSCSIRTS